MYGDQLEEFVSGYRGLKGQLVRFLLVQEDLEGIRVTGYLTLSELVLNPTYLLIEVLTLTSKSYGVTNQRQPLCQEAYTRHTGNYTTISFIQLFIYLFNHFHHIVWNTQ